ncbi:MAG TPA: hypothetical protein DCZ20_03710 [Lachnospiraceae bacterium]|nr:hypothetical protein [Lachnospiraceae bacterium]
MNDFYTEQLVKRKTPASSLMLVGVCAALTILSFLVIPLIPLGIILPFAFGFATYLIYQRTNLEYEYLYVNGEMDVDKIMAKTKRKKIFSCNVRNMEIVAPAGAPELRPFANIKAKDFSSDMPDHKVYEMVLIENGEKTRILFEPNDVILEGMRMLAPRKVIR